MDSIHPYQEIFSPARRKPEDLAPAPLPRRDRPLFVPFSTYDPADPFAPAPSWCGARQRRPRVIVRSRRRESHRTRPGHRRAGKSSATASSDPGDSSGELDGSQLVAVIS